MLRLFGEPEPNARPFEAITRFLDLLDDLEPLPRGRPELDPLALSFQLKLLWLSGYLPHLTSCAECGATDATLVGYSPRAGGALCGACANQEASSSAGALALSTEGIRGIEGLLASPLAQAVGIGLS